MCCGRVNSEMLLISPSSVEQKKTEMQARLACNNKITFVVGTILLVLGGVVLCAFLITRTHPLTPLFNRVSTWMNTASLKIGADALMLPILVSSFGASLFLIGGINWAMQVCHKPPKAALKT